jgi:hypothetical protein
MKETVRNAKKAMADWVTIVGSTYKNEFDLHMALKDIFLDVVEPTLKRSLGLGKTVEFSWISFANENDDEEAIWISDDGLISVQGGMMSRRGGHEDEFGVDYITLSDIILNKLTKALRSDIAAVSSCEQ